MLALEARGIDASPHVWDDPAVAWDGFDLVVIRSTWDYAARRGQFLHWAASVPRVLNAVDVLAWNTDKRYLRELELRGIATVPTTWISGEAEPDGVQLPDGDYVVKPVISAGARDTARYGAADRVVATGHIARLLHAHRDVMIQPYIESVDTRGETGLIYIDGVFSHAFRKGAILRTAGEETAEHWAPEDISARVPDDDERALADAALDAVPWPRSELLYARADVVRASDGGVRLMELELTEPSLYFRTGDGASHRLAEAIARRCGLTTPRHL